MLDVNDLDQVLPLLEQVERRGKNEYVACCPAHDDQNPSLSIKKSGGRLLIYCHGGSSCSYDEITHALERRANGTIGGARKASSQSAYSYVDERGRELFQVVRTADKQFKQRRKVNGRWVNRLGDARRVLYRLPDVLAAVSNRETVYIAEGEKDVEAIVAAGGVATCNPGGAGKWKDEYAESLAGTEVVVVADRDETGRAHASAIKRSLVGAAHSVRVVEALTGKDAADHLEAGHALDEFVPADRFVRVDLGEVIEGGIPEPEMLVTDVLYAGKAHALMGEPGDGKTLLTLALCAGLIEQGKPVAWFDEENGPTVIASRLVGLGATTQDVSASFFYFPFTEPTLDDADELVAEVVALAPVLVVFDSGADMYVAAGLDENDNMAMTRWAIEIPQRLARVHGIATVVLEHVAKNNESNYQRGAGAKKAKVDAAWRLKVESPFDATTVGQVDLVRAKDRLAHLPARLRFNLGGKDGAVVFTQVPIEDETAEVEADAKRKRDAFRSEAINTLRREGATSRDGALSQRTLTALLSPAAQEYKNQVVQALASDPTTPVSSGRGERNSIVYWVEDGESDD